MTGTLRFDQTSKFLGPNRTGTFPSIGAARNSSNEEFMQGLAAVSQLKARASYGLVGNQDLVRTGRYMSALPAAGDARALTHSITSGVVNPIAPPPIELNDAQTWKLPQNPGF